MTENECPPMNTELNQVVEWIYENFIQESLFRAMSEKLSLYGNMRIFPKLHKI